MASEHPRFGSTKICRIFKVRNRPLEVRRDGELHDGAITTLRSGIVTTRGDARGSARSGDPGLARYARTRPLDRGLPHPIWRSPACSRAQRCRNLAPGPAGVCPRPFLRTLAPRHSSRTVWALTLHASLILTSLILTRGGWPLNPKPGTTVVPDGAGPSVRAGSTARFHRSAARGSSRARGCGPAAPSRTSAPHSFPWSCDRRPRGGGCSRAQRRTLGAVRGRPRAERHGAADPRDVLVRRPRRVYPVDDPEP
jgi:hypothetical protein